MEGHSIQFYAWVFVAFLAVLGVAMLVVVSRMGDEE
jgi:hypothetical protein